MNHSSQPACYSLDIFRLYVDFQIYTELLYESGRRARSPRSETQRSRQKTDRHKFRAFQKYLYRLCNVANEFIQLPLARRPRLVLRSAVSLSPRLVPWAALHSAPWSLSSGTPILRTDNPVLFGLIELGQHLHGFNTWLDNNMGAAPVVHTESPGYVNSVYRADEVVGRLHRDVQITQQLVTGEGDPLPPRWVVDYCERGYPFNQLQKQRLMQAVRDGYNRYVAPFAWDTWWSGYTPDEQLIIQRTLDKISHYLPGVDRSLLAYRLSCAARDTVYADEDAVLSEDNLFAEVLPYSNLVDALTKH